MFFYDLWDKLQTLWPGCLDPSWSNTCHFVQSYPLQLLSSDFKMWSSSPERLSALYLVSTALPPQNILSSHINLAKPYSWDLSHMRTAGRLSGFPLLARLPWPLGTVLRKVFLSSPASHADLGHCIYFTVGSNFFLIFCFHLEDMDFSSLCCFYTQSIG